MNELCTTHNLLSERDGIVRVPFLVRGCLVAPPDVSRAAIESAFAKLEPDATYASLPGAQALRFPLVDRAARRLTDSFRYLLMPAVAPLDLLETDFDALAAGPYALPADAGPLYLEALTEQLGRGWPVVEQVRELERAISELPEAFLDASFAAFAAGLGTNAARQMIDAELSLWGRPGSAFLDGWVEVPGVPLPDPAAMLGTLVAPGLAAPPAPTLLRAMPTRQLHITAGNAPGVPIISALRMLLTRSVGTIKLPSGAVLPGALLALAAACVPEHPLTQHLSVVYWPGGDELIEQVLFAPGAFDRIVVWGAPGSVAAVQGRAAFTRTVTFNPRYGVLLVGHEAAGELAAVAARAAQDTLIYNQRACNAAFVHYVERAVADSYAEALRAALAQWDEIAPQVVPPSAHGQLRRMRRGRYGRAEWLLNERGGAYESGVVVLEDEFELLDHPLFRLAVVRPVDRLDDALGFMTAAVSTAGIYPETRRLVLRDRLAARGVTNILSLGQCERAFAGMPHDGMAVLSELVEWKNG
jgi:hypothetical protein